MVARIIDGKSLAATIRQSVSAEAAELARAGKPVHLAAILVGDSPAAKVYAENQDRTCQQVGIAYSLKLLPANIQHDALIEILRQLNNDATVTGIMVHLPLPAHLNPQQIQYAIDVMKDVEGVNPANIGHVVYGHTIIAPCTALAVVEMIHSTGVPLRGAEVAVVGASRIAGKPIALLLSECQATVTLCHIHTHDVREHTRRADIVVVAVGKPGLIGTEHVKPGAVVIDVGINRMPAKDAAGNVTEKTVGDVQFDAVSSIAGWISPVPGGVGPMTVAMLLRNTLRAARLVHGIEQPFRPGV